jgi:hypothetical protein
MVTMREPSGSATLTGADAPRLAEAAPTSRPIRISTSRDAGDGTWGGRLEGIAPEVQLTSAPASNATARQRADELAPVIAKPQLDLEVLGFEKGYDGLQLVP